VPSLCGRPARLRRQRQALGDPRLGGVCGRITYPRYVALDAAGTLVYTTLVVLVGWFVGERAVVFLTTDRRRWIFLGAVVLAFATLMAYRLWRRHRFGRAQTATVGKIGQES
jgi:membrane protein DedA with SNARE-associated domain